MRVRLFDMVFGLIVLLVQQIPKILGWESYDVGGVLFYYSFGVMFEDVWQFLGHDNLLCAVDSLFSHVSHFETYFQYITNVYQ